MVAIASSAPFEAERRVTTALRRTDGRLGSSARAGGGELPIGWSPQWIVTCPGRRHVAEWTTVAVSLHGNHPTPDEQDEHKDGEPEMHPHVVLADHGREESPGRSSQRSTTR